jgi:hypothetical protein
LHAWPKWRVHLAVGAIFRDEARYLPEWLEFHRQYGVERFYLYENDSTDDWNDALAPFRSVVELRHWPEHPGQMSAYTDCVRRHRWDTRWLALIDVDEFLFSPTGRSLPEVLRDFRWVAAVAVNWRCYGPSGHEMPTNTSTVQTYTYRARDDHPLNRHVKSIVFPAAAALPVRSSHFCRVYGRFVGERNDDTQGAFRDPPTTDQLRINHYIARSAAEWRWKHERRRTDSVDARTRIDLAELDAVSDPILAQASARA